MGSNAGKGVFKVDLQQRCYQHDTHTRASQVKVPACIGKGPMKSGETAKWWLLEEKN